MNWRRGLFRLCAGHHFAKSAFCSPTYQPSKLARRASTSLLSVLDFEESSCRLVRHAS
jgi:hypothetical protein